MYLRRAAWWSFLMGFVAVSALADQVIYNDALQNGWASLGWATTINYNNTSPLHSGTKSIAVTIGAGWQAIYLHHSAFDSSPYTHLSFWINGGSAGSQHFQVQAELNGTAQTSYVLPPLPTNSWQQILIPLTALGVASKPNMDGVWIQDATGAVQPTFYLDDMSLVALPTVALTAPLSGEAFTVGTNISLTAVVTPNGHTINGVDFRNGASVLGSDSSAPYTWTWTNVPAGAYSLTARVTFDGTLTSDSTAANVVVATNSSFNIGVDTQLNRHPISPLIYGVAFASSNDLFQLRAPLNRSGGNSETRYNWQLNAHNTANDWYFESIADSSSAPAGSADNHVLQSKTGNAEPLLTIPMIGWTSKLGSNRTHLASFSVAKYAAQKAVDPYWSDAGNGVASAGTNITNDPNDASFPTNSPFQAAFVQHLTNQWGLSTNGGVRYYLMDNEHSIWQSTHRDVHPVGPTMQEIRDKIFDYAGVVKSIDPAALVLGPEEWGWSGYFYSGFDQQWSGANHDYNPAHYPDRTANGGWDYIPWLLNQFRLRAATNGVRLLDYCTVHDYPQSNEFTDDVSVSMQLQRNRSTRQLWDLNYNDPSWINSIIKLIPRMKSWVTNYYPGTKIGITEYNWGAEGHINGATAQADIYGIFGREGLDLGTRWTTPAAGTPTFNAMKLFRNYDGNGAGFGDASVYAGGPNPDLVSTFGSIRSSDGALVLAVINKQLFAHAVNSISISNQLLSGTGQVWQLSAVNLVRRGSDSSFTGNNFTHVVPPQSITFYVLPQGPPPQLRGATLSGSNTFDVWLDGVAGQSYVLERTVDFFNWTPVQTNTLSSGGSMHLSLPAPAAPACFYRAKWKP